MKHIKTFEDLTKKSINESSVTSDDLRLSIDANKYNIGVGKYGTPCGAGNGICEIGLSNEVVAEFIDVFFGGVLDNIDTYKEGDNILIAGGEPTLKKLTITTEEFNYFIEKGDLDKEEIVYDLSQYLSIKKKKFNDIENNINKKLHPDIICWLFSSIVEKTGSSFRCDYMKDGKVELESE